jgi:hypothetical protein
MRVDGSMGARVGRQHLECPEASRPTGVKEARLMNRGLTLKCLHCDSHEFHILYEMESQPGDAPQPRQSGSYECVHCGHVADAAEQAAMVAKIQQEREAHAQGAKDDPEP